MGYFLKMAIIVCHSVAKFGFFGDAVKRLKVLFLLFIIAPMSGMLTQQNIILPDDHFLSN